MVILAVPCTSGWLYSGPLEQVQYMHPRARLVSYADDTHLQGGQEDFLAVCEGMSIHLLLPHLLHHLLH